MRLKLEDIGEQEVRRPIELPAEQIPGLSVLSEEEACFVAPIRGDLRLRRRDTVIELAGEVTSRVRLRCGRCLVPTDEDLDLQFQVTLSAGAPETSDDLEEETELSGDQLDVWMVEGDEIDLLDPLAEQILMVLPTHVVCSAHCKGLCSGCGADLNKDECQCKGEGFPGPFDALKDLKLD